jgi:alkylation response protein AidB-like acyl-CoA dehydrogenase
MTPPDALTPEATDLRARVRRFIDEHIIPQEAVLDKGDAGADALLAELQSRAKAEGLWALNLPAEIGGGGLPFMPYVYVNEVIGRCDHAMAALGTHITQDSWMLHLFGTPGQKERWLLPMVRGEITPSVGMTEPEVAGSDPTGIRSTARLEGDTWVVNAHKWFTTGASVAAFTTMMVVTEPEAAPHARMSMILVPTDAPGYEVVRIVPTMGDTTGLHCEIYSRLRVPERTPREPGDAS